MLELQLCVEGLCTNAALHLSKLACLLRRRQPTTARDLYDINMLSEHGTLRLNSFMQQGMHADSSTQKCKCVCARPACAT